MQGAPLRQALIDAGLGRDVDSNFESDLLQPFFSIIVSKSEVTRADEFMRIATEGWKKPFTGEDVYRDHIPLKILKRVDRVFQKGLFLFYYTDPTMPEKRKSASVFFRKTTFGAELNLGSRQRVREFEDLKTRLNTISKLSDVTLKRKLPIFSAVLMKKSSSIAA